MNRVVSQHHFSLLAIACLIVAAIAFAAMPARAWANGDVSNGDASRSALTAAPLSAQDADSLSAQGDVVFKDTGITMYRLYNPYTGEHFYTSNAKERDNVDNAGWNYEGIGWIAPSSGAPVYRLYNPFAGDHHYTLSSGERDWLVGLGWRYEGIGWYSGGNYKIYRQYNPNATTGTHNFTSSIAENNHLAAVGWKAEGVGWYALADTVDTLQAYLESNLASVRAQVTSEDATLSIESTQIGDTTYLFFPSYADLTSVRLVGVYQGAESPLLIARQGSTSFTSVDPGKTVNLEAFSSTVAENGARLYWFSTASNKSAQRLAIMKSSGISTIQITSVDASKNRAFVEASADHSAKANVVIEAIGPNGQTIYNKDTVEKSSTIKGRGNSTWGIGNKKPYQISLNKKADLLETGNADNAQKKWLLLANANDATLLHNTIAYNLALELGMVGTECTPVDLYYDGEYRGSYLLCEKIEVKSGRVEIDDLEGAIEDANPDVDLDSLPTKTATNRYGHTFQYVDGITDPDDITGGYLLEVDGAYYRTETCWFMSSWGAIAVKSPECCSYDAMKYISEYVELAIRRLNAGTEAAEVDDNALFDLDSLARTYMLNEFAKCIDAFHTSTFLYKDSGDVELFVQPVWDFDGSMGVRTDTDDWSFITYQGFVVPSATRSSSYRPVPVAAVEAVQDRVNTIWTSEISPLVKTVLLSGNAAAVGANGFLHSLVYYRQQISASEKMDEALFGLTVFDNEMTPFETYEQNYNYLVSWLTWRTAWMDDNIERLSGGIIKNAPHTLDGIDYGLVYDASYYKAAIGRLTMPDDIALEHFVNVGMEHGIIASRNFNVSAYKNRYEDLRAAFGNDLKQYYLHYIEYGFNEHRIAL